VAHVAHLAAVKSVRNIIKAWQRKVIKINSKIVVEGRDSATVILKKNPKFDIAFYFDCPLKKAAYRRYIDLGKKIHLKKVLKNLKNRRTIDRSRKHSPLQKHKNAVLIRSDLLSKYKMILKMSKKIDKVIEKI
jgi:Cytidylate kinase